MTPPPVRHFIGLDLGQPSDFTALAVLERPLATVEDVLARRRPTYALRHLRRFPLGTPYPAVAESLTLMLSGNRLSDPTLVVDQTGVGRAVVDMLFDGLRGKVDCSGYAVTITAGHAITSNELWHLQVPKKELISTLQVLLQARRLHVARTLPEAAILVKELENFRVHVTAARPETFESWREGRHDDLVLAVALSAWMGEQTLPTPDDLPEETVLERFIVI